MWGGDASCLPSCRQSFRVQPARGPPAREIRCRCSGPRRNSFALLAKILNHVFFIVGPTASGKSEIAADVAAELEAEIVSADAFQIYDGLDLLAAKPDAVMQRKAPHHLVGTISIADEMNAEKFRGLALSAIAQVNTRGKIALVVGGSGLYVKAITHGFSAAPAADRHLRAELNALTLAELGARLIKLDPKAAQKIDMKNRRRVVRAVEIYLLSNNPISAVSGTNDAAAQSAIPTRGIFVFRDREELYDRINRRVEAIFEKGVVEEVRGAGPVSATACQMIGLREIRELISGRISRSECLTQIQQATRRYAKRQLTWFRRQTNFEPLNLSLLTHAEAVQWISRRARHSSASGND